MGEPDEETSEQRRERLRRAGLRRSETLLHTGALDLVSAVAVLVGLFFVPSGFAAPEVTDLAQLLLGVACGVLVVRALLRWLAYTTP